MPGNFDNFFHFKFRFGQLNMSVSKFFETMFSSIGDAVGKMQIISQFEWKNLFHDSSVYWHCKANLKRLIFYCNEFPQKRFRNIFLICKKHFQIHRASKTRFPVFSVFAALSRLFVCNDFNQQRQLPASRYLLRIRELRKNGANWFYQRQLSKFWRMVYYYLNSNWCVLEILVEILG